MKWRLAARVYQIQPSPTLATEARAKALRAQGVDVISFSAGEPDFDTPEWVKEAAIRAIREGFTKYTPATGILELKEAISEKLLRENGLHYGPDQILVTCGAKHALYHIAQALLEPGDEVIVPVPYWTSYPDQIRIAGGVPVFVPTREEEGFLLRPETLEAAITPRTRALILNTPGNPTGAAYPEALLRRLAAVAVQHDLVVIADEVYERICYDGFPHVSIATLGEEIYEHTLVVNGLSKAYAMTGWRIGYVAGPQPIIEAMGRLQSQSTSNPNSIAQRAAVAALRGGTSFREMMVAHFDQRRRYVVDRLNRMEGVSCLLPQGAFYVFPRVSGLLGRRYQGRRIDTTAEMAEFLLEVARVAVVPGEAFGAPGYLRLSYATSMELLEKGLDRMEAVLSKPD